MTMIQINNAILHVFDQHSGVTVYSKEGLDCTQKDVADGGGDGFDFMILLQLRLVVQVAVGCSLNA